MEIGLITTADPFVNRRVWSGSVYNSCRAIKEAGYNVRFIPVKKNIWIYLYYLCYKGIAIFLGKNSNPLYSRFISKQYAKTIDKKLIKDVDILFVPAMTPYIAYLETEKPIIYFTDSTFNLYKGYYPSMTHLMSCNIKEGQILDKRVYDKSYKIICSSNWAYNSIVNDYGISCDKVEIMEFGPNLDEGDQIQNCKSIDFSKGINLLFIGVDWDRKGGDVAVNTCLELNKMGIKSTIHVVGCKVPSKYQDINYIKSYGFLNKNNPEQYQKLIKLIENSDVFILPTKAEAAGIVFAEASSYRLPIFTYDTGGVGNYVINGVNGYRLPVASSGKDFADKIRECLTGNEWNMLKDGCGKMFNDKLNWHNWAKQFKKIVDEYETTVFK